ncbi:collagen-like protein [Clostridiaceae bacterium Marseille-Q4149]|nr:collagen-like protein [Clostridiaceae bacterium Marseille-Q4149]
MITYSDGTIATLGKVIGPRGEQGIQGEKGDTGAQGEKGEQGSQGEQGVQGIQGEKGEQGIQGEKGDKGDTGAAGQDGQDGQNGVGISRAEINAENELVLTLSNGQSINLGAVKGEKGDKGDAGVGIANVSITEAGNLKVTLTNNTSIDLGNIKGADGIGITKSEINAQGHLVLTYSDGNTSDLGVVVGQDGAKGVDGKDGADGVGISNVAVSTDGVLVITLSNDDVKTLGNIKGEKGEKGDKGDTGRGIDHMDIVDGELWVYYTDGTSQNLGSTGGSSEGSVLIFVELPDGTYGVKAGEKAKDVAVIEIPETYNGKAVTQIIANGFEKLTTLQQITFPNCLEKVGSYAFYGCTSLSSITIPENTTYIGKRAFYSAGLKTAKLSDATSWHAEPLATITKIRSDDDITDAFSSGLDLGSNSGYHNSWGSTYRVWFTCDLSDQTTAANALIGTYNGQGGYEREGFSKSYRFDASVNYYDVDWVKR